MNTTTPTTPPRVSKGLTLQEVRRYRKELHEAIVEDWKQPAPFRPDAPAEIISGSYIREGKFDQAELQVQLLPDNRLKVEGLALWGTRLGHGPNIGELGFEAPLSNSTASFDDPAGGNRYRLNLWFEEGTIVAFVDDYNHHRLHSALGYLTPAAMLAGRADTIWAERDRQLETARARRRGVRRPSLQQTAVQNAPGSTKGEAPMLHSLPKGTTSVY